MAQRYVTFFYAGVFLAYLLLAASAARADAHWMGDFTAYYTGGLLAGSPALYDLEAQERVQRELLARDGHETGPRSLPFINPPHAVLPFACLARLATRPRAFVVWLLLQLALTAYVARLVWEVASERTPRERLFIISLTLALPAFLYTYLNGQLSIFMLACLLQHYLSLREGREMRGGLWLALATFKPQLTVLPAAALAAARRLRALTVFVACVLLLVALSSLLLGWHRWLEYPVLLARVGATFGGRYGADPRLMTNFKGLLSRALGEDKAQAINTLAYTFFFLSIILTLLLLLWRAELSFDLSLTFTVLLNLFFSPHLNPQDTLLLAAPAILLYLYLRRRGLAHRPLAALAVAYPPLFWALFLAGGRFALGELYLTTLLHLTVMAWAGYLLLAEYRKPSSGTV